MAGFGLAFLVVLAPALCIVGGQVNIDEYRKEKLMKVQYVTYTQLQRGQQHASSEKVTRFHPITQYGLSPIELLLSGIEK